MDTRMQQGGSQYGVTPEMASYSGTGSRANMFDQLVLQQQQKSGDAASVLAEAASPISSRPPARANFEELAPGGGGFPDDEALVGEDAERGSMSGNRWPRQETVALLQIRSEMDAAFKEATLKGPLWEDVSRKLSELGYSRSAKKCKEKFENVQKYYKRTKEGRAGRQDGKSYRFFSQLEALHSGSSGANTTSTTVIATSAVPISIARGGSNPMVGSSSGTIQPPPISAHVSASSQRPDLAPTTAPAGVSGSGAAVASISFSSNTSSSSGSEDDNMEEGPNMEARKRKRTELGGGGSTKMMMAFFERLMKDVVEKQEEMLQRFLETMEKREQDRMIREEAWRRQEMARLNREQEIIAQERAISASRDAALIAFLQKFTGQTIQIVTIPAAAPPPQQNPPPPQPLNPTPPQSNIPLPQPQQQQQKQQHQNQSHITEVVHHQPQSSELILVQQEQPEMMGGSFDPTSSRWPKVEVIALIKLRSSLELKYQEAGPKGPLWEEISKGMRQLGYNRSSKRCKEKWENINKYFKKVKESKKKRPEDAKTCPYFHELDALYSKKLLSSGGGGGGGAQNKQEQQMNVDSGSNRQESGNVLAIMQPPQSQTTTEIKNNSSNTNQIGGNTEVGGPQIQTSNGGLPPSFFEEGTVKKPEDIVKELMAGSHPPRPPPQHQAAMDDYDKIGDSDDPDEEDDEIDEEEDDECEEDGKMGYKIQYQKPSASPSNGHENQSKSFLAMVQ